MYEHTCPVCGWECSTLYIDVNGNVIGCDNEITAQDIESWEEEFTETALAEKGE